MQTGRKEPCHQVEILNTRCTYGDLQLSGYNELHFSWRDAANNILSNSPAYTHCVTGNETTLLVEYLNCNGNLIMATDDVIIDILNLP
jgi:hypothetical protein